MRDLARPGRFRLGAGPEAACAQAYASRQESGTDASSIAAALPPRPEAASSRPGGGDLVGITLLAHGGIPGAIVEATIALAVVAVLVAVWLHERRRSDEPGVEEDGRDDDRGS
jgi:hypothetical protein